MLRQSCPCEGQSILFIAKPPTSAPSTCMAHGPLPSPSYTCPTSICPHTMQHRIAPLRTPHCTAPRHLGKKGREWGAWRRAGDARHGPAGGNPWHPTAPPYPAAPVTGPRDTHLPTGLAPPPPRRPPPADHPWPTVPL